MKYQSDLPEIKWVRKIDPDLDIHWRYLYRLTRRMISDWSNTVDGYVAELKRDVTAEDFQRAIEADGPEGVIERMAWLQADDAFKVQAAALMASALERAGKAELQRLKLGISFELDNPYVLPWVDQNVALLVTRVSDETKKAIRAVIHEAYLNNDPPRRSAMQIRNLVGLTERDARAVQNYWRTVAMDGNRSAQTANDMADTYARKLHRRRAENIARTETINSANAGVRASWGQAQDQGLLLPTSMMEWVAAIESPRTCQICLDLDSQQVPLGSRFYSQITGASYSGPTAHPSCLVPDTEVVAPNLIAGSERWFEGTVITLVTADGDKLSITPNHPVLTPHGWVAADLLKEGDDLVRSPLPVELARLLDPDHEHMPTRVKEVTDALKMAQGMMTATVPVTNEHFHGDGIEGDVNIVLPDSGLRTDTDTIGQGRPEVDFIMGRMRQVGIHGVGKSLPNRFANRSFATSSGGVSGLCNRHALLLGHTGHSDECVSSVIAVLETVQTQDGIDESTRGTEGFAECQHAFSTLEPVDDGPNVCFGELREEIAVSGNPGFAGTSADLFGGHALSGKCDPFVPVAQGDTSRGELVGQSALAGVSLFGQLVERFPGLIATSQIVSIERSVRRTHVYNLQTAQEWYLASNIITHNCRCAVALVTAIPI